MKIIGNLVVIVFIITSILTFVNWNLERKKGVIMRTKAERTGIKLVRLKKYSDLTDKQKLFAWESGNVDTLGYIYLINDPQLKQPCGIHWINEYQKKELFEFYEESEEQ